MKRQSDEQSKRASKQQPRGRAKAKPLGGIGPGNGNYTSGETYIVDKVYTLFLPLIMR
ncbi:MAG: hypothetical protein ABIL11_03815 [Chloroflexota bacterium]